MKSKIYAWSQCFPQKAYKLQGKKQQLCNREIGQYPDWMITTDITNESKMYNVQFQMGYSEKDTAGVQEFSRLVSIGADNRLTDGGYLTLKDYLMFQYQVYILLIEKLGMYYQWLSTKLINKCQKL